LNNIKLERVLDGQVKSLPIVNISQFDNIVANDLDKIFIRTYPFRSVEITGAILNPGSYLMNEGDSIEDVIEKSGGFTDNAYAFGTVYQNETARAISEQASETLYQNSLQNISEIIKEGGPDTDYTPLIRVLTELKESEVSGRVVVNLDSNEQPILVQDGDNILVPENTNQVYIFGSVSDAGSALFAEGQNFEYYINKKGGLTSDADNNNIFVLYPNGETFRLKTKKNLFTSPDNKIEIYPGSVIYIPESLNDGYQTRLRAQAYAAILGSLGVSLASLSVLKD
jgi:protein involved in polysaccharide export with SLBB domain